MFSTRKLFLSRACSPSNAGILLSTTSRVTDLLHSDTGFAYICTTAPHDRTYAPPSFKFRLLYITGIDIRPEL